MIRWCSSRYEINLSIKIYNHKKRCRRLLARGCSLDSGGPHLHRQDDVSDSHNVFGVDNRGFGDFADVGNAVNFAKKHDFTAIHGSKIVLDVTAEREVLLALLKVSGLSLAILLNQRAPYVIDSIKKGGLPYATIYIGLGGPGKHAVWIVLDFPILLAQTMGLLQDKLR
ncbi:hypothetical protein Tco_0151872 [Tanacetum coccineum]